MYHVRRREHNSTTDTVQSKCNRTMSRLELFFRVMKLMKRKMF